MQDKNDCCNRAVLERCEHMGLQDGHRRIRINTIPETGREHTQ